MGQYAYGFKTGSSRYGQMHMFINWRNVLAKPELFYQFAANDMFNPKVREETLAKINEKGGLDYSLLLDGKSDKDIHFQQAMETHFFKEEEGKTEQTISAINANKEKYRQGQSDQQEQQKFSRQRKETQIATQIKVSKNLNRR